MGIRILSYLMAIATALGLVLGMVALSTNILGPLTSWALILAGVLIAVSLAGFIHEGAKGIARLRSKLTSMATKRKKKRRNFAPMPPVETARPVDPGLLDPGPRRNIVAGNRVWGGRLGYFFGRGTNVDVFNNEAEGQTEAGFVFEGEDGPPKPDEEKSNTP